MASLEWLLRFLLVILYLFLHACNDVTYMINDYKVRIADARYHIACLWRVTGCTSCYRVVTYYRYVQKHVFMSWTTLTERTPPAIRHIHVAMALRKEHVALCWYCVTVTRGGFSRRHLRLRWHRFIGTRRLTAELADRARPLSVFHMQLIISSLEHDKTPPRETLSDSIHGNGVIFAYRSG